MTARHLSLIVWEQAAKQIEEANSWWREHRQASPDALAEDLARAFDRSPDSRVSGRQLEAHGCMV